VPRAVKAGVVGVEAGEEEEEGRRPFFSRLASEDNNTVHKKYVPMCLYVPVIL
jgi:hypothetical protein